MYAITSGNANCLKTHIEFPHSDASTPKGQRWLDKAVRGGYELRCLCKGMPSSPLHTRLIGGIQHPCRAKGTQKEHLPLCTHGDSAPISQTYGVPRGSIVEHDGRITVNFDLLMPDDEPSTDVCGDWKGGSRDHGASLRALMWLLIVRSNLNCFWPGQRLGDPWEALIRGARGIDVSRSGKTSTLADLLLTPVVAARNWQAKRNYRKLCDASGTTKRVLVACLLPVFGRDKQKRDIVDMRPAVDLRIDVSRALLARAVGQGLFASQRHVGRHAVLAFGCATAKESKEDKSAWARMNQLVFLPIGQGLMPLPTQLHVDGFDKSLQTGEFFGVEPTDDPMIAMRVGRNSIKS